MKKAMKSEWYLYIAAVPLLTGQSAFRIGRSQDIAVTLKTICEGSPVPVAQISAIRAGSNRFALAAEAYLTNALDDFRRHGNWFRMSTASDIDRNSMARAMQGVTAMLAPISNGLGAQWKTLTTTGVMWTKSSS